MHGIKINTDQIEKLHKMLSADGIPHTFKPHLYGYQICYPDFEPGDRVCSAITIMGSYGYNKGLIEIMGLLTDEERKEDSVVGWLTADDVFQRIKKHWEGKHHGA